MSHEAQQEKSGGHSKSALRLRKELLSDEMTAIPKFAEKFPQSPGTGTLQYELSRVVTLPNILSISRLFLLLPILLALQAHQTVVALGLMLTSWVTDALDGYFARRRNQVTNLGRILDHLVDKIWVGAVLVMLAATRELPRIIAGAVIGRDMLIALGSLIIIRRQRIVVQSDIIGKATGSSLAILMFLYILDNGLRWLKLARTVALWVAVGLTVASLVNYIVYYFRLMYNRRATTNA